MILYAGQWAYASFVFYYSSVHHLVSLILQTPIFRCKVVLSDDFCPECIDLGELCQIEKKQLPMGISMLFWRGRGKQENNRDAEH